MVIPILDIYDLVDEPHMLNVEHLVYPGVADSPCLAVGDTYCAATKLAVGSYTSPGTNALSVTGNVSMPGYLFCAG